MNFWEITLQSRQLAVNVDFCSKALFLYSNPCSSTFKKNNPPLEQQLVVDIYRGDSNG